MPWLNECPIYIWRPVGEYPESSGVSSGVRIKLNLWGCISCRGASDFVTPDLNPIEMIWADMKKHIASKLCKTLEELKLAIWEYRQSLTAEKCTVYITHLREKVIPAVISRNGGWSNM